MLSKELEVTLNRAFKEARLKHHEYLTVEHLLLSLLDNQSAKEVLVACGGKLEELRQQLTNFIQETTPKLSAEHRDRDTQPTLGFQRVLQRAVFHVQSSGRSQVTGANVLVAVFSEQDSQAVHYLKVQKITRLDVINFVSHGTSPQSDGAGIDEDDPNAEQDKSSGGKSALDLYGVNLNVRAKNGKIDPLVGREEEVARVVQILCRRRKNNPILVGEPGVGKTAIAEGLAKLIVEEKVPEVLKNSVVYSLDLGAMLAGTRYRGDFEKRFKILLKQLNNQKQVILFIDEIHIIIGAGAASGGVLDAANLIKPMLTSGDLRCMGSTTYQEYRSVFQKDHALARRFQKVDVVEPTSEQTYQILKGLQSHFEEHHSVTYSDEALRAAVDLASKHINDRFLPDKAIDVIDEAGAFERLAEDSEKKKKTDPIGVKQIETIVAKIARIPNQSVSTSDRDTLQNLERNLKMVVYGQDKAISTLVSVIKLSRAGLREPNKPWGSFLLAGPTGVGKTEISQQLAKLIGVELIRFDMSEYMEPHSVSRLIGAPPGYVGYDQGGLLTDAVLKHPYSVVLLDEIEKAHPDLFNLLLQVMDNGTLTDNNGRRADFRHILLIMTTNAGSSEAAKNTMGFFEQDSSSISLEAIERQFAPEFRNRLDAIIQFNPLSEDDIRNVVDKFIAQLQGSLGAKGVSLDVSNEVREWLAVHGYDKKMGARPMSRIIQQRLKQPLAEEILFGELMSGGHACAVVAGGEIKFEFSHKKPSKKKHPKSDDAVIGRAHTKQ